MTWLGQVRWLVLQLLLTAAGFGVERDFCVDTWQAGSGLPSQSVNSIAQTDDGYLWVGTLDGLARFDGHRFTIFDSRNTPELGNGKIAQVARHAGGGLWISTEEGRLILLQNGVFSPVRGFPLAEQHPVAEILAEDSEGRLWITTWGGKVICWKDGKVVLDTEPWRASPGARMQVRVDENGQPLVNGFLKNGVSIAHVRDGQLVPLDPPPPGGQRYHAASRGGGYWMSSGNSVRLWKEGEWRTPQAAPNWHTRDLSIGISDREGHLWLATTGRGVLRYDRDGSVQVFGLRDGLGGDYVRTLFEDREGSIWVGLAGGGLSRIRPAVFRMMGSSGGRAIARFTALAPRSDGTLWAGTSGDGLFVVDQAGVAKQVDGANMATLSVGAILAEGGDGARVGTTGKGLQNYLNGLWGRVPNLPSPNAAIKALFRDSVGRIWIGRHTGNEVAVIGPDGGVSRIQLPGDQDACDVRCFAENSDGTIWIGTDANGVFRWNGKTVEAYTRHRGLPGSSVRAILADGAGGVWIGLAGEGLVRWKEGRFSEFGKDSGFPIGLICGLVDDGLGNLWVSGERSIIRVPSQQLEDFVANGTRLKPILFDSGDGLSDMEAIGGMQATVMKRSDGRLVFSTTQGIAVANPSAYQPGPDLLPVIIEEMRVDGQLTGAGGKVGPDARHFEFRFTGISLAHPENVFFQCKLDGIDRDWRDVGRERSISYTSLPAGMQEFRVRARNRDHAWTATDAVIQFEVLPPWWKRPWITVLLILGAAGAVALLTRLLVSRRHDRQMQILQQRHALETERARIARDIHDQIGTGLTEIALIGDIIRMLGSDEAVAGNASEISVRARELARSMDETVWAINPKNDSVDSLVTYLSQAVSGWLRHTDIRCRFDLIEEAEDVVLASEARNHLYLACKEAVHNAIQHAGATEIQLQIRLEVDVLVLAIRDDGQGFDPASTPPGDGLSNFRFRLEEIGGSATVESVYGSGTTVTFRLPLGRFKWDTEIR